MLLTLFALIACRPEAADPCAEIAPGAGKVEGGPVICRVAGTGQLGFNGDGLPAAESWLYWPSSVELDPAGRLVIVDFNNMRLRRLEPDGTLATIAGSGEHSWSTPGETILESALENPVEARFLPDGGFYIAALHEARVLYVGPDQRVEVYAGTGEAGLSGDGGPATEAAISEAAGLAVLAEDVDGPGGTYPAGTLIISDTQNHCLRAVTPDGTISMLAGQGVPGYAGDGDDLTGVMFSTPERIDAVAGAAGGGAIYVADTYNHAVRRLDLSTGAVSTVAGGNGAGFSGDDGPAVDAQLDSPYGVDALPDGTIYIADSGNSRVRKIAPDGTITTLAGSGEPGLSGDGGHPLDAAMDWPIDVVADPAGNVYIAEMRSGVVRVVRPE